MRLVVISTDSVISYGRFRCIDVEGGLYVHRSDLMNAIGYGTTNAHATMNRLARKFGLPEPILLKIKFDGDESFRSSVYMNMETASKMVHLVSMCSNGIRHMNKILAKEVADEIDDVIKTHYDNMNSHSIADKSDNQLTGCSYEKQVFQKTIDVLFRVVRETNDDKTMRDARYCITELSRLI